MMQALDEGDFERAELYSKMIDNAQEKIQSIIDQEDANKINKTRAYTDAVEKTVGVVKDTVDVATKFIPTAGALDLIA